MFPFLAPISVGLGAIIGYFLIKYIALKMGKPFPAMG
ncbi:uncharacterized protein METZ01_LOCUS514134, partial [marine metagenome]